MKESFQKIIDNNKELKDQSLKLKEEENKQLETLQKQIKKIQTNFKEIEEYIEEQKENSREDIITNPYNMNIGRSFPINMEKDELKNKVLNNKAAVDTANCLYTIRNEKSPDEKQSQDQMKSISLQIDLQTNRSKQSPRNSKRAEITMAYELIKELQTQMEKTKSEIDTLNVKLNSFNDTVCYSANL